MSDAAFERAHEAWESSQLNRHLAEEEAWDAAYDKAEGVVWGLTFNELYEMSPPSVVRDVEFVAERLTTHIAELVMEGLWDD